MASDVSKSEFRGLLVPDPRLSTVWVAESSFTQADPQPGIPSAQGDYELSLTSSGVQAASGQLRIRTQRPGHPSKTGPGAFVWRNQGDGNWRGWDTPNVITNYQSVVWTDGTGPTVAAVGPDVVSLDDQTIVCAYHRQTASAHELIIQTMAPASSSFGSAVVVYSQSSAPSTAAGDYYWPCLVKLPNDRLLLYYLASADGAGMVRAYESTDKGASWSLAASSVLDAPITIGATTGSGRTDYQLTGIRAAYGGGQVLMMVGTFSNDTDYANQTLYTQYASDSAGLSFTQVEVGPYTSGSIDTAAKSTSHFDVVYQANAFVIVSQYGYKMALSRIGSAFQPVTAASVSVSPADLNFSIFGTWAYISGGLAACVSDDGVIYAHATGVDDAGDAYGCVFASLDDGKSIIDLGKSSVIPDAGGPRYGPRGLWFNADDGSTYPLYMQTCFSRGRVNMLTNHAASPGNEDNSLTLLGMGGPSTVTMPLVAGYYGNDGIGGFTETWLPFDLPGDTGTWTATVTGTQSLAAGQLQLSTSSAPGQTARYSADLTSAVYNAGYIVRASLICDAGSLALDACAIRLRLADGADDYDVSVRFSSSGFRVYDNNGSSQVGGDVSITMTNEYEFIIAVLGGSTGNNDGKIQIWYRLKNSNSDRNWIKSTSGTALTDDQVGAAASSNIIWGNIGQSATSKWTEFLVCRAGATGTDNIVTQANPGDLWAKPYASSGYRSYVDAGTFITAHDGPARIADRYNVDTRYGYSVERIFFSESQTPRVRWRSTGETEATIAFPLDSSLLGTDDSCPGNDVIGLALLGINWKTGVLEGYDSAATSWVTIANIDSASGLNTLGWKREGNTVIPSAASAGSQYVQSDELEGATFALKSLSGVNLRKVKTNTSGKWSGSTVQKLPTVILEDVSGSDQATGTLGWISMPNIVVIAKLNGSKYAGYRIKISAQDTVEGYFTIGQAIIGWVEAFGRQYSRGRVIETTANTTVTTRTDGTTSSKSFGPSARNVQFSWTDGVDVSSVQGSSPDPDYIKGSTDGSAEPIASVGDVPYQMEGIVRMLNGPEQALVYLPSVAKSGNTVILNRRNQFIPGRMMSPARLESVVGDEDTSPGEVFRVASVNIQEIV